MSTIAAAATTTTTQSPRLTKKQKKGIAFRERKHHKDKSKHVDPEVAGLQVPIEENLDSAEIEDDNMEVEKVVSSEPRPSRDSSRGNRDEKTNCNGVGRDGKVVGKKRKREEEGEEGQKGGKPQQKKRKGGSGNEKVGEEGKNQGKQRFILFVGMLF